MLNSEHLCKKNGLGFKFFATRSELFYFIKDVLGKDFKDYIFFSFKLNQEVNFAATINSVEEAVRSQPDVWELWLGSKKINPGLDSFIRETDAALNGFVNIQISHPLVAGMSENSISLLHKVYYKGKIITHREYQKLYQGIRRRVTKNLKFKSLYWGKNGDPDVEDESMLMTNGVAQEIKQGVKYIRGLGSLCS